MTRLKFAMVFTVIVCITGSFSKTANAQSNLGGYCFSCAYNPMYPHLGKPQQRSLVDSLYAQASDEKYKGNYAAAFQLYTKIISLDSQEAQAYFNRGSIKQSNLNDRAGAMEDFRIAFELFRQKGDNYMTRASMEHIQQLR
jgi:tetratricopeptide (TPR) repeat protein